MSERAEQASPRRDDKLERSKDENELVISYLFLRKTVGWIGTLLPIVLIAGNAMFFTSDLPDSMSGYYYTHMRDIFVGSLCALGLFLVAYAGYDEWDRWITNIAGVGAIGAALLATKPTVCAATAQSCPAPAVRSLSTAQTWVGNIHLVFSLVAVLLLGVMALRFAKLPATKDDKWPAGFGARFRFIVGLPPSGQPRTIRLDRRSATLFRVCGIAIIACALLGVVSNWLPGSIKNGIPILFILEALALFAFGVSWFVKGQTLWKTSAWVTTRLRSQRPSMAPPDVPPPSGPPPVLEPEPLA
jgi:hypothetical protein